MKKLAPIAILALVLGALIGCGGDGDGGTTAANGSTATTSTTATTATTAGGADITFSDVTGSNADTTKFTAAQNAMAAESTAVTTLNGSQILGTTDIRSINVTLTGNGSLVPTDTDVSADASSDGLPIAVVTYTEGGATINPPRGWVSDGGSVTILERTASSVKVRLNNVHLAKDADNDTAATGSFVLNGTFTAPKN